MVLTFRRNTTQHSERLVAIHFDRLAFLVVVTWAWNGSIVRDALFVVDSIVGISACTERELFASKGASLGLFEVAGQLVLTRLREPVFDIYSQK